VTVLDLGDLDEIDHTGIAVLVAVGRDLKAAGSQARVVTAERAPVRHLLGEEENPSTTDTRFAASGNGIMEANEEGGTKPMRASRRSGDMSFPETQRPLNSGTQVPWYVYDRHANLLHIARTLAQAEAWAFTHWDVASVGDREEVDANDYFYLLMAKPQESGFRSRDYQARIIRQDRVTAIGLDPQAEPAYPE